jgi:AcrR family transcriptional regulator
MSTGNPATRERILTAARDLLEDQLGAGPSMGQIASRAGVSRQALYLHFADRAALLLELTRAVDVTARTADEQRLVDEAPTGRAALAEAIALQARLKPKLHGVATALDTLRRTDPDAQAAWEERDHARLGRCAQVVDRLAAEGELAPGWAAGDAARLMWALTSQRVWEDLVIDQGWPSDRYTSHLTRLLEQALLVPSAQPLSRRTAAP